MATSLGTLTLDLVARVGSYTAGLTEAERATAKSAAAMEKSLEGIGVASLAVGTALGGFLKDAITSLAGAFPALIDQAAQFQDIADKTGGAAEGFASFAVSAKVAGVSLDSIASASVKLSSALLGVDDDSKAAGAALKALGIPIAEFKKLAPDEQIKKLAETFGTFADGASKAQVAVQLFGRSGAELLKFFKDYTDNGGGVNILTKEMIKQADDHADAQARLRAEISLYASALATQFIEPTTVLVGVVKDAVKELLGFGSGVDQLALNNGVRDFAIAAGRELANLVEIVKNTKKEFDVLADFAGTVGQIYSKVATFDLSGAKEAGAAFRARYGLDEYGRRKFVGDARDTAKSAVQAFDDEIARARSQRNSDSLRAIERGTGGDARPSLPAVAPTRKGGRGRVDRSAEQEAKAQLASDLDEYKNTLKLFADANSNSEKLLSAMRSAGLVEEGDYYRQRQELLANFSAQQIKAQEDTIARLQKEQEMQKFTGKDAIENARKIAQAETEIAKIRADAANNSQVLAIQEEASYKKIANALLSAKQAAQDYFDTTNRGYQRELEGIGAGNKARELSSGISQIEEKYRQQRQQLQNQRQLAENAGTFGPEQEKQFNEQLKIINDFQEKSLSSYQDYYSKLTEAQGNWINGAKEALQNYADEAKNVAKGAQDIFGNGLKGLEDQFTNLFSGKKVDVKGFFNSITDDLIRQSVKQKITGPIAEAMNAQLKSGEGFGNGGMLKKLFGNLFGSSGSPKAVSSLTGDPETDKLIGLSGGGASPFGEAGKALASQAGPFGGLLSGLAGGGKSNDPKTALTSLATAAQKAADALNQIGGNSPFGGMGGNSGSGGGSWIDSLFGGSRSGQSSGGGFGSGAAFGNQDLGQYFASGGYTGSGDKWSPAGTVHRGEYVLDAATTRRMGVPALDALRAGGNAGQVNNISLNVMPGASRETAYQAGRTAARELARVNGR